MKMDIMLESKVLIVLGVKKTTKAKMFQNLKAGDRIKLSVPVKRVGTSRGRSYPARMKVENMETGEETYKTFNEINSSLNCFDLREEEKKAWIVTNESMEIEDVFLNEEAAYKYAESLNSMSVNSKFTVEEFEVSS